MSSTSEFAPYSGSVPLDAGLAVGATRLDERGEDRLLVEPELAMFGVFDGLGGHADGAAAAELAATTVATQLRDGLPYCRNQRQAHDLLIASLHAADAAIERHNGARSADPTTSGATTATVALLWPGTSTMPGERIVLLAHVGDSRAHLLHAGRFETLTLDHAALNDSDPATSKARQDRLDDVTEPEELTDPMDRAAFAYRHMLASALTGTGDLDVRAYVVPLAAGDRLLLNSDGLHDNLTRSELASLLAAGTPQEAADELAAAAKDRSAQPHEVSVRAKPDDISVLVVEISAQPSAGGRRPPT
jgi:protein phosphatase